MKLDIAISADRSSVRIGGTVLTTAELEHFIHEAAKARAALEPAVSFRWSTEQLIDATENPAMKVGMTTDQNVMLALRHEGFGWCCFDFDPRMAKRLVDFLAKRVQGVDEPSLDDIGESDGPQH